MKKLVLIFTLFICNHAFTQNLKGSVIDDKTGLGIPFAKIYCLETKNGATSDSNGNWSIENIIRIQMN